MTAILMPPAEFAVLKNMRTPAHGTGVVCHYGKVREGGLLASARIARMLADRYGFVLVDDVEESGVYAVAGAQAQGGHDYCLIVSSAAGFASPEMRECVGELAARARRLIFVQNDFMTEIAGQVGTWHKRLGKPYARTVWSTIPSRLTVERATPDSSYVNWNMLTYDPARARFDDRPPLESGALEALFYYGAHRRDRVSYFKRWLSSKRYRSVISTSTRVVKKWHETLNVDDVDVRYSLLPQMTDCIAEMRGLGTVGLYAEDAYSHKVYCSPANRFYEMLSAGVPMVFDRSTLGTWEKAGYEGQMRNWMPKLDGSDLEELVLRVLAEPERHARAQHQMWARDYRDELETQLQAAERKVGLHAVG